MNSAADLGGIFIVLDMLLLLLLHKLYETGPLETDWKVISSAVATGQAGFVYFHSCFENVHTRRSRDTVYANSGSILRLEKAFGIQKQC